MELANQRLASSRRRVLIGRMKARDAEEPIVEADAVITMTTREDDDSLVFNTDAVFQRDSTQVTCTATNNACSGINRTNARIK